jgi:ABC-type uncharacterized transport system YnjBCD ATPase subunit
MAERVSESEPKKAHGGHLRAIVSLRRMDLSEPELEFLDRVVARSKANTQKDVVVALIRAAHAEATRTGIGWYVPKINRLLPK